MSETQDLPDLARPEPEELDFASAEPPTEEAPSEPMPEPEPPAPSPVDLNRATAKELSSLPGIGPTLARRIVEYRESVHRFEESVEITAVPGIAEATYNRLKQRLMVGPAEEGESAPLPDVEAEALSAWEMVPPPELEPEAMLPLEIAPPAEAEPEPVPPPPKDRPPVYERVIERRTGWLGVLLATILGGVLGAALALLALWFLNGSLDLSRSVPITNLERYNEQQDQHLSLLSRNLGDLSDQWSDMDARVAGLDQQIAGLEAQQAELQRALDETQDQVERTIGALSQLNGRVDQMDQIVEAVESSLEGLKNEMGAMSDQLVQVEAAATRFQAFLDGLRELLSATPTTEQEAEPLASEEPTRLTATPGVAATPRPTVTSVPSPTPSGN
jgi:competence ComEA-like helix-hairpin-helix protein